mgnify:CR=1 FL=1|jgi:hypothetical protein
MEDKKTAQEFKAEIIVALEGLKKLGAEEDISTPQLVEVGVALWQVIEKGKKTIGPIKDVLREEGLTLLKHQPGTKVLKGNGHVCTVILPVPKLELSKTTDIERLQKLLGGDFKYLFNKIVTVMPRKELGDRLGDLVPDKQQIVLAAVERKENTARVGFKKGR